VADSGYQEQMVHQMDEGTVLLQGTLACLCAGREVCARPAFTLECLRFRMEPPFDCPDDDLSDVAFIWASKFIRGPDTMEEFVACSV
jgi:hypothetical protein